MEVYTEQAPSPSATVVPAATHPKETPVPTQPTEIFVSTLVDNVNLRVNPGMLFKVSRVMPEGTRLRFLGYEPGMEWIKVMNDEGIEGWVNVNVAPLIFDGVPPIITPEDVLLVTGSVVTELGTPVSGIGFEISQGSRSTVAHTNADGVFYAFLPNNMSGTWNVRYAAVSCASNTMDANCNCVNNYCGSAYPEGGTVQLPQEAPLIFVWK
jgi:hypothetical protein